MFNDYQDILDVNQLLVIKSTVHVIALQKQIRDLEITMGNTLRNNLK